MITILIFAFSKENDCPAKGKLPKVLEPETLKHYIKIQKLKTPEDLICCLARDFDTEVTLITDSLSAQTSDYLNPRALVTVRYP